MKENVVKVTVLAYRQPRKSERTWLPVVGSIGYVGRKQVTMKAAIGTSKGKVAQESKEMTMEEKVYEMLMSQSFVEWQGFVFMGYVEGEDGAPTKEEILEDIEYMLKRG